jgi:hypothetical protein
MRIKGVLDIMSLNIFLKKQFGSHPQNFKIVKGKNDDDIKNSRRNNSI